MRGLIGPVMFDKAEGRRFSECPTIREFGDFAIHFGVQIYLANCCCDVDSATTIVIPTASRGFPTDDSVRLISDMYFTGRIADLRPAGERESWWIRFTHLT